MTSLSASSHVSAPIDAVFAVFIDLERAAERLPSVERLEVLSDGPFGYGTRWRETRAAKKKDATAERWVTGFQPPHGYKVTEQSRDVFIESQFRFKAIGMGTRVSWSVHEEPQTLSAKLRSTFLGPIFSGSRRRSMLADLAALREVCEGESLARIVAARL